MKTKPVIGLSGSRHTIDDAPFIGYERAHLNDDYVTAVAGAGALPLIVRIVDDAVEETAADFAAVIDGLLLSGGHDLTPALYGEAALPQLKETMPARDAFDRALLLAALRRGLPIFGICRGFQLINAVLGGKLLQDLSLSETPLLGHDQNEAPSEPTHLVSFERGNVFGDVFGASAATNSFHHQTVIETDSGLTVCGRTSDGVIEAVAADDLNIMAVQWHPEMMAASSEPMRRLFRAFTERALRRRARQGRQT